MGRIDRNSVDESAKINKLRGNLTFVERSRHIACCYIEGDYIFGRYRHLRLAEGQGL